MTRDSTGWRVRARPALAAAVALALLVALAGCAPAERTPPRWWSGMVGSLLVSCLSPLQTNLVGNPGFYVELRRLGWGVYGGDLRIQGDDDGGHRWTIGPGTPYVTGGAAVARFLDCIDRYRVDWSLARADSPVLRVQL